MKKLGLLFAVLLVSFTSAYAQFKFTSIDCPGAVRTSVVGINNHGEMVGHYKLPGGILHAMMIKKGQCIPLAPKTILGTNRSYGFKINDRGDVVGMFADDSGYSHGYLLRKGVLTILDFPGASDTVAWGINNFGTVVGWWDILDAEGNVLISHGYIWKNGNFTQVDLPGAGNTFIDGINDWGDLVGLWGPDPTGNAGSAFFWPKGPGPFTSFDAPFPGVTLTQANDINDFRAIVGMYTDASGLGHSFLRVGTAMIYFDYPGAMATSAWGINSMFQIVGGWQDSSGGLHGYLAQPNNQNQQ